MIKGPGLVLEEKSYDPIYKLVHARTTELFHLLFMDTEGRVNRSREGPVLLDGFQ